MDKDTKLKGFRLNSMEDPTDEQLLALMEKVGEYARRQSDNATKVLDRMMSETRMEIERIRQEQSALSK